MYLTPGERERLKQYFNLFLAAQKRCYDGNEQGRMKKAVFAAFVIAFGFVLGDDGEFEKNLQMFIDEINSFGVIGRDEIDPRDG
jgi:hypothetical protein